MSGQVQGWEIGLAVGFSLIVYGFAVYGFVTLLRKLYPDNVPEAGAYYPFAAWVRNDRKKVRRWKMVATGLTEGDARMLARIDYDEDNYDCVVLPDGDRP